jgi:hypothetical protein
MPFAIWNVSGDSAIVAAFAVLVALIAAITAQVRLRAQLEHDSKMRERDATRDALDSVVTEITAAVHPMNCAGETLRELFRIRAANLKAGQDHGAVEVEDKAHAAVQALRDRRSPLLAASFRLHLRFFDADPIIGRLADWRATFDQLAEDYQAALESSEFEMKERFDAAGQTATQLGRKLNLFLTEARAWATAASD